jgi:hypothetical protein
MDVGCDWRRTRAPPPREADAYTTNPRGFTLTNWGKVPEYQITFTLKPYIARRHAEARAAAERIAHAIEQLASDVPEFEDMQLVEVTNMTVNRVSAEEDQP